MRKLELVYLHELLSVVREEYEQELGHAINCEEYDELRTHPQAIAQPKAEHQEAIRTLAGDLTTVAAEESSPDADSVAEARASHHET